ncbi:kinesin-domain-containing protein [Calocera viscosa TUFC12733]|uniref:Kinesin-domain-containing protein n=1 Tax=Calocera viscosa (strain TUFC12733) TaxID=1330018 RepID=A0A167RLM6_CALVF|nr:kinesin-domain-containing protein [Calocera viscosa TUFC12733]
MADKKDKSTATSVQVAVRIRPPTSQDASIPSRFQRIAVLPSSSTTVHVDSSATASHQHNASTSTISSLSGGTAGAPGSASQKQAFTFDRVLGPQTPQADVYAIAAEPLVQRFLEGFNCTILAYGQTSSGKTYSMTGPDLPPPTIGTQPPASSGIIPRALHSIFSRLPDGRGGASFEARVAYVELYNEDLIDLLVEEGEPRREVMIREDKDGRIKWEGLKEVSVKSVGDVLNLLRHGGSLRRTNETDMNAQSSRSHAIFSLTLTQRRPLNAPPSPNPSRAMSPPPPSAFGSMRSPTGRTSPAPSRLARPSSTALRATSPAFGRPSSVAGNNSLKPRTSGIMTPGRNSPLPPSKDEDDDQGWVVVTSKFHFVDLAGSERLKRTAAQGERIKEGISINSGLLALGNVISALAALPIASSGGTTHVPYRDSKLTRLLQDSLGGNAHTLMLACVAPAEYNLAETLNTLKYAARARGIKNVVSKEVREEGWADMDWLQAMVTKLRKEIEALKAGGAVAAPSGAATSAAGSEAAAQLANLQRAHEELALMYKERQSEIERLKEVIAAPAEGGVEEREKRKYAEIVAPVVEEYERRMSALEVELKLARVALDHTNAMFDEKEAEFEEESRKRTRTEQLVEELRARIVKLSEREGSTERYVQDLEQKLRMLEDNSSSHGGVVSDLRTQISKHREEEAATAAYITDLEVRLQRSDESINELRDAVEQLEEAVKERDEEVAKLERRVEVLGTGDDDKDSEMQRLMEELEESEDKVRLLESRVAEAEREKDEWEKEKERQTMETQDRADKEIDAAVAETPTSPAQAAAQVQLAALRMEHTTAISDLASMRAKYESALSEISSLTTQLSFLQSQSPVQSRKSPDTSVELPTPEPSEGSEGERNSLLVGRRETSRKDSAGPRSFFRSAASSDQLRARSQSQSQQSLAQELSLRPAWPPTPPINGSAPNGQNGSLQNGGLFSPVSPNGHAMHSSLSISTSRELRQPPSPRYSLGALSPPSPRMSLPPNGSARMLAGPPSPRFSVGSFPPSASDERSVRALESEVMRLQEALMAREAEITALEIALKNSPAVLTPTSSGLTAVPEDEGSDEDKEIHIAVPPTPAAEPPVPSPMHRRQQSSLGSSPTDAEGAAFRHEELLRSMAQKESTHREQVESLNTEIESISAKLTRMTKQCEDLTTVSRDQALNMATEMEGLHEKLRTTEEKYESMIEQAREQNLTMSRELESVRSKLRSAEDQHDDLNATIVDLRRREEDLTAARQAAEEDHAQSQRKLRAQHEDNLRRKDEEAVAQIARLKEDHAAQLKEADMVREGTLTESQASHIEAIQQLRQEQAAALDRREAAWKEDSDRLKVEHSRTIAAKEEEHSATITRLKAEHANVAARLQEEKEAEVERLKSSLARSREEHDASMGKLHEEVESSIARLKEQHASTLADLQQSREEAVSRAADKKAREVEQVLNQQYDQILARKQEEHNGDLEELRKEHASMVQKQVQDHERVILSMSADHQAALQEAHQDTVDVQQAGQEALDHSRLEHQAALDELRDQHSEALAELQALQTAELETVRRAHDLLADQVRELAAQVSQAETEREQLMNTHQEDIQTKQSVITKLYSELSMLRTESDAAKTRAEKLEADLKRTADEQSRLVKEAGRRDSLVQELERHRQALAETHEQLNRAKDEKDLLAAEIGKRESVVKELHDQLAQVTTPKVIQMELSPNGSAIHPLHSLPVGRLNSLTKKLPPASPPPTVPPPPVPIEQAVFNAEKSMVPRMSYDSEDFRSEAPSDRAPSGAPSLKDTLATQATNGSALQQQYEDMAHLYEESQLMIKTLEKQLEHCEADLQANQQLVATLENELHDAERHLRKSRLQSSDLAKERDALNTQIQSLQTQLRDAQDDSTRLRRSMQEEKQTSDRKLDEERKARERARALLDQRMEDMQKRKSKFVCM